MIVDYIAKRSIQAGHVLDTSYQITISLSRYDRNYSRVGPTPIYSLNGNQVTITNRNETKYTIATTLHKSGDTVDQEDMREFLDSVTNGEPFSLDSVVYKLDGGYSESRESYQHYRYSFTVIKSP